jgi:hypothetical protein
MTVNSESQMQNSREGEIGIRHGKGEQRHVSKRISLQVRGSWKVLLVQRLLSHVVSNCLAVACLRAWLGFHPIGD